MLGSIRLIWVMSLLVFLNGVALAEDRRAQDPELPPPLRTALRGKSPTMLAVYRWNALRNHPLVSRLQQLQEEELDLDLDDLVFAWQPAFGILETVPISQERVEEIWISMERVSPFRYRGAWLRTSLDEPGIVGSLEQAGWVELSSIEGLYTRPLDPNDELEATIIDQIAELGEEDSEAMLFSEIMRRRSRVLLLGSGWVGLAPPRAPVSGLGFVDSIETEKSAAESEGPPFPFDQLLSLDPSVLMSLSLDVPGNNDSDGDSAEPLEPISDLGERQLREIERELAKRPELETTALLSDMAVTVSETDGGLRVEVLARRPDSRDPLVSELLIEVVCSMLRIVVYHISPELAYELGDYHVIHEDDGLRFDITMSQASVLDAINLEAERLRELRYVRRRLEELRQSRQGGRDPVGR
jgi:hypothetical protein